METRALFLIIAICFVLILAAKLSPPLRKRPWWLSGRVESFAISYSVALTSEQIAERAKAMASL